MSDELLDLDVLSRAEKVRFDLVDRAGRVIGELHPQVGCQIQNDTSGQIKRKLTGFVITADEYDDVNPLTDRVRPYWVLDDGDEYPLGVFLFAEASTATRSYGETLSATLVDQGLILGQGIDSTVGFSAGTSASAALTEVFNLAGFFTTSISVGSFELGAPVAWPAGKSGTTWAKIVDDLCRKSGAYPAYFDNDGTPTVRLTRDVDGVVADFDFRSRIAAGSIGTANDLLIAPNRYMAIDTSATTGAIVGVYDIPDTAPHSFNNRGFRITRVVEAPGVGDVAQALAAAQAAYTISPVAYATASWSSPADPRLDTFDVVKLWDGENWLETSWALTCAPGGPMTHKAVRVWL